MQTSGWRRKVIPMEIDVSQLTQLINGVGFPIVACGALFWMLNNSFKELKDTLDKVVQSLDKMNDRLDKLETAMGKQ